jgi:two-component system, LytTR family, response regulator
MNYPNLAFNQGKEIQFLAQHEVMYCISDDNYTDITIKDNRKIVTSKSLKELENIFTPELFLRIHNSYIVNLMHVVSFSNGKENIIEMIDGKKLQVSRRKKQEFLSRFYKL